MKRNKATSEIQLDNKHVRVTKYKFHPGEETGMHTHLYDYIVTPINDGTLLLVDKNENRSNYDLVASKSYFRKAGMQHNVINNGKKELVFIEIELKNIKNED